MWALPGEWWCSYEKRSTTDQSFRSTQSESTKQNQPETIQLEHPMRTNHSDESFRSNRPEPINPSIRINQLESTINQSFNQSIKTNQAVWINHNETIKLNNSERINPNQTQNGPIKMNRSEWIDRSESISIQQIQPIIIKHPVSTYQTQSAPTERQRIQRNQ